jgi:nucleoside-triphosphatase THEP1
VPFGRRGCTPGTRVKVIKRIMEWASDFSREGPRVFWVDGLAGTGKSTLAFTIADLLQKRKIPCATFFCSRQAEDTRRELFIVPTIVDQLADISSSFAHALASVSRTAAHRYQSQMQDMMVEPWKDSASL